MSSISIDRLSKVFRGKQGDVHAVRDVTVEVEPGTVLALLGPSGCGKTTTLRMVAGAEQPTGGRIVIGGKVVYDGHSNVEVAPNKRGLGMVFQSYALWPHMTVRANVAYPLKKRRLESGEQRTRAMEALDAVGCGELADRYPGELSGGQQQRVAVARALAPNPEVILFDEPLSNLDARLRQRVRYEITSLQRDLSFTALYVTHDQEEALTIGHRCAVLRAGVVEQVASPETLYRNSETPFVFEFLGTAHYIEGSVAWVDGGTVGVDTPMGRLVGTAGAEMRTGDDVRFGFRSEDVTFEDMKYEATDVVNVLPVTVEHEFFVGRKTVVEVRLGGLSVRVDDHRRTSERSERGQLAIEASKSRIFPLDASR